MRIAHKSGRASLFADFRHWRPAQQLLSDIRASSVPVGILQAPFGILRAIAMTNRPTIDTIRQAAQRLRDVVMHTPLVPLHSFDPQPDILLKLETLQVVTSFKIRGVFNAVAVLSPEERANGLSTVSAGNTAQALAWTGRHFNVPARSLMPDTAPATKVEAVLKYGGEPILVPHG